MTQRQVVAEKYGLFFIHQYGILSTRLRLIIIRNEKMGIFNYSKRRKIDDLIVIEALLYAQKPWRESNESAEQEIVSAVEVEEKDSTAPSIRYSLKPRDDGEPKYNTKDTSNQSQEEHSEILTAFPDLRNKVFGENSKSCRTLINEYIARDNLVPAEVYKKALIDRRLFSKVMASDDYAPSFDTLIALGIALQLTYDEECELLNSAGLSFAPTKRDKVIRYFFEKRYYNIFEINDCLYQLGYKILGERIKCRF
ncbi:MAG: hypothetical protein PUG90_01900 [Clostridia bacterium]|nr:hypothetical protein [Clostridia bacterium]